MKRAPHIRMTEREFRARKRREFRTLRKAMKAFLPGSAFLPEKAFREWNDALDALDRVYQECKGWWRHA